MPVNAGSGVAGGMSENPLLIALTVNARVLKKLQIVTSKEAHCFGTAIQADYGSLVRIICNASG
jgi:hypothetical protein